MAIWPFGRKNKKVPNAGNLTMAPTSKATTLDILRRETAPASGHSAPTLGRIPIGNESGKRQRSAAGKKLTKASTFSNRESEKAGAVSPIPALPEERRKELNEKSGANQLNRLNTSLPQDRKDASYDQEPKSASSMQPENFSVLRPQPTLKGKRSANDDKISRMKSNKRKADDHAREQQVKSMSSPVPTPNRRPTSHNPGPLARDSKQMRGGMTRNGERPMSEVSLPMQESFQSQVSLGSDQHAFKVSAFDALSPRPTIRYSGNPRSPASSLQPSRTSTRKEKQPISPDDSLSAMHKKRVDDLADDMDAPSLRELMERDRRRHDRQRRADHDRLQRKLERKAAKQKEQEAKAKRAAEAGVSGTEVAENTALRKDALEAPTREERMTTPESWLRDPSREHLPVADPFQDAVMGGSTSHLEPGTPVMDNRDEEEPVLETAKAVRLSSASMSPPALPKSPPTSPTRRIHEPSNVSQFSELAPTTSSEPPTSIIPDRRRDSDQATNSRFPTNWKSIFRRSDTRGKRDSSDRGRDAPSEFSNTSRESVSRQMPPSAFARIPRVSSGTPVRTQSRFREDLPELPISPPDSRMQSPEVGGQSALPRIPGSRGTDAATDLDSKRLSEIHPAYREEVALSRNASLRATSPEVIAASNLSQSLASVDSEGSWLTGRPVKRLSQLQPRESAGSLAQQLRELQDAEDDYEEDMPGTPEAEKYMGTLSPAPDERPKVPKRRRPLMTDTVNNSDDNTFFPVSPSTRAAAEREGTLHGPVGRHPTIVRQGPAPRVKSREGLLNDFQTADSAESSPSGDSPISPEGPNAFIQRATSVDLGKGHARHISAGSARLLNLPSRTSTEIKRLSASSGERSPLGVSPRLDEGDDSID